MRYLRPTIVFAIILANVKHFDSKAIEIICTGDACECPKKLPFQINFPVPPKPVDLEYASYGYKVDAPPTPKKYSYLLDLLIEEPELSKPKSILLDKLFTKTDKIVYKKPDCVEVEAPLPPPPPVVNCCPYAGTSKCTCGCYKPPPPIYVYDYEPPAEKPCSCGECPPGRSYCRYVNPRILNKNHIIFMKLGHRNKRDLTHPKKIFPMKYKKYLKPLETPNGNLQTSKRSKRDIKGEYDLLQKEHASLDLTIPEIVQYMPETLMPNFRRGKCNIGCSKCTNKQCQAHDNIDESQPQQSADESTPNSNENPNTLPIKQFELSHRFGTGNYLKRSVGPLECPYYPAITTPPYASDPPQMAERAENPGNPNWAHTRPLIDPNGDYLYDRLGHKYEYKNGRLKLIAPQNSQQFDDSTPDNPLTQNITSSVQTAVNSTTEEKGPNTNVTAPPDEPQPIPVLGAPLYSAPQYDPQMEKVIRDIVYRHPEFIKATAHHAPGSLTPPQEEQEDETMDFLGKLVRARLDRYFGINDRVPSQELRNLNRYSRATGASIKFIPVVTVDNDKVDDQMLPMD